MRKCSVKLCDRDAAKGYTMCDAHRARVLRTGSASPEVPIRSYTAQTPTCAVNRCGRAPEAKNLCPMHYLRYRHYGTPLGHIPRQTGFRVSLKSVAPPRET